MDLDARAALHAALGDRHRLLIVDELRLADRSFQELVGLTGLSGNLLAHHLGVLGSVGLIERRTSEGDRRRRYLVLRRGLLAGLLPRHMVSARSVLFLCAHNSARSQFASALWRARTGRPADSAGREPAPAVHPKAVTAARELGVDLTGSVPKGYEDVAGTPDLVVTVCDRAVEGGVPFEAHHLHWSIPDPVRSGRLDAFRAAFGEITERVGALAAETEGDRWR